MKFARDFFSLNFAKTPLLESPSSLLQREELKKCFVCFECAQTISGGGCCVRISPLMSLAAFQSFHAKDMRRDHMPTPEIIMNTVGGGGVKITLSSLVRSVNFITVRISSRRRVRRQLIEI